ncbi:MAG: alanine/glycine:cation symporter family protein [Gemmatimonadota bacterium]
MRDATWGVWLTLCLLGAGVYLTVLLRGLQFRRLAQALRFATRDRVEPDGDGDLTHYQALSIGLASSVGIGNLAGVSVALAAGGPGALVWMWAAGLLAMATKYAEAVLGVRFRETDVKGRKSGGPMQYLANGVRWGALGRVLALIFAACLVAAAIGFGNGMQAHAVASAAGRAAGVPALVAGGVTALLVGLVTLGGVRSVGRVTALLVPAMIVGYLGLVAWSLSTRGPGFAELFGLILESAVNGRAAGGGAVGFGVGQALRSGLAQGAFSGEAGAGTGAIAAATARTREPVRQALVQMLGTFVDTIVVCGATGFLFLALEPGVAAGAAVAADAGWWTDPGGVAAATPGSVAGRMTAGLFVAFAVSTMLAWAYYGERGVHFLFGQRAVLPFRLLFIGIVPLGAVMRLDVLWTLSDALRGLLVLPNLLGLVVLSGIVARETRAHFEGRRSAGSQPSNRG